MPSFLELIAQRSLTSQSNFSEIAQAAIEAYYLIPYPGKIDQRPRKVNRKLHGGVHVSRAVLNAQMLIALYQKYKPVLIEFPLKNKDKSIKLLQLAIIYHDSTNSSEIKGVEQEHADCFSRDMLALGYTKAQIEPFAIAMAGKDKLPKNFLQKIIHDADCLDIIRCTGEGFKKEYLDIIKDLRDIAEFEDELDQIIKNHHEIINAIERNGGDISPLHLECEHASNVFEAVRQTMINQLMHHAMIQGAYQGKDVSLLTEQASDYSILDLYGREHSEFVRGLIDRSPPFEEKDSGEDLTLSKYRESGIFVRALKGTQINNELQTLSTNKHILSQHNINDSTGIRKFIGDQFRSPKREIWTPKGFKWRPCSFIQEGLPIKIASGGIAVLIDPAHKGTIDTYYFKRNAFSGFAASGAFNYHHQTGPKKDKETIRGLRAKVWEQNRRRLGTEDDPNLHYYGQDYLSFSEVLGTYDPESVIGIVVSDDIQSIKDALLLRSRLGDPRLKFYRYNTRGQLTLTPTSELIKKFKTSEDYLLLEKVNREVGVLLTLSIKEDTHVHYDWGDMGVRIYRFSLNKSNMPSDTYTRIKSIFTTLKTVNIENADYDEILNKNVSEDHENLYFDFTLFWDNKNAKERCAHENAINRILLSIKLKQNLLLQLEDIQSIENITKTPNLKALSVDTPLQFSFKHPQNSEVHCTACFNHEGKSVIKMVLADSNTIETETTLLNKVAQQYYQQRVPLLNELLMDQFIKRQFESKGIAKVNVKLDYRGKSYLRIEFQLQSFFSLKEAQNFILLHLPNVHKIEIEQSDKMHEIVLSDIDQIDKFINKLKQTFPWLSLQRGTKTNANMHAEMKIDVDEKAIRLPNGQSADELLTLPPITNDQKILTGEISTKLKVLSRKNVKGCFFKAPQKYAHKIEVLKVTLKYVDGEVGIDDVIKACKDHDLFSKSRGKSDTRGLVNRAIELDQRVGDGQKGTEKRNVKNKASMTFGGHLTS